MCVITILVQSSCISICLPTSTETTVYRYQRPKPSLFILRSFSTRAIFRIGPTEKAAAEHSEAGFIQDHKRVSDMKIGFLNLLLDLENCLSFGDSRIKVNVECSICPLSCVEVNNHVAHKWIRVRSAWAVLRMIHGWFLGWQSGEGPGDRW